MKSLEEIRKAISLLKPGIHERFGVSNIAVFGSYVRGEQREDCDIDVLVEFDREVDLFDVVGLKQLLTESLGIEADVVLKRSIRPELKGTILNEAMAI